MTVHTVRMRRATDADLERIGELEAAGFDHARWSRESWADEVAGHYVVLAQRGEDGGQRSRAAEAGTTAGPITGAAPDGVAAFSALAEVAELLRVVVDPERRGGGVGRALVEDGIRWAREQGAERMLLEVEESNAPARALYERTGFATIARRDNYYGTGAHALVMQRELSHE